MKKSEEIAHKITLEYAKRINQALTEISILQAKMLDKIEYTTEEVEVHRILMKREEKIIDILKRSGI